MADLCCCFRFGICTSNAMELIGSNTNINECNNINVYDCISSNNINSDNIFKNEYLLFGIIIGILIILVIINIFICFICYSYTNKLNKKSLKHEYTSVNISSSDDDYDP